MHTTHEWINMTEIYRAAVIIIIIIIRKGLLSVWIGEYVYTLQLAQNLADLVVALAAIKVNHDD